MAESTLWMWRHPRPEGALGRCIGRTDLTVDPRRAKRLARRIQRAARRAGLPHIVHSSPQRRCADVGRWLRRWGWRHIVDDALSELDFGDWDGRAWTEIARAEIDAWCADFETYAPGAGESLLDMLARVAAWHSPGAVHPILVVAHGGWMQARRWIQQGERPPASAAAWPACPAYGTLWQSESKMNVFMRGRFQGNTSGRVIASARTTRRGRRHWHVRTLFAREPGDLGFDQPLYGPARIGKARSRSQS